MKLPNAEHAQVDREKIVGYLLSIEHEKGRSKAVFFMRFGFRMGDWERLAKALRRHALDHEVTRQLETKFGHRYTIEGEIETPVGRRPSIRAVWMVRKGESLPRLVTAHPS